MNDTSEKSKHDEIVKQVDTLITLKQELPTHTLQSNIDRINTRIEHCEERIDQLVFELYDLSKDEIETVKEYNKK